MSFLVNFRRQINRDDGRFIRVGNRKLGWIEAAGMLIAIGALVVWQFHKVIGISGMWAGIVGAGGLLLAILGNTDDKGGG